MTRSPDALGRLWWSLRRHWWLVLIVPLVIGGLGAAGSLRGEQRYEAPSLVIASNLAISAEQLPRLGENVFTAGAVAERAISRGDLAITPEEMIEDYAELQPIEDTILLRVVGKAADPQLAAEIANLMAAELVRELNTAGPGVGEFAVQQEARVPQTPAGPFSLPVIALFAIVGGILSALCMLGLWLAVRDPVLSAADLQRIAQTPVTARLDLLGHDQVPATASDVAGLSQLATRLYPSGSETRAFLGLGKARDVGGRVAALVADVLEARGPVLRLASSWREPARAVLGDGDGSAVVIDGRAATGGRDPRRLPADTGWVLLVEEGASRVVVDRALARFHPGDVAGALLVAKHRAWHRRDRQTSMRRRQADRRRDGGGAGGRAGRNGSARGAAVVADETDSARP